MKSSNDRQTNETQKLLIIKRYEIRKEYTQKYVYSIESNIYVKIGLKTEIFAIDCDANAKFSKMINANLSNLNFA